MSVGAPIRFLSLEVTGRCQLTCAHCYADSSPLGAHGPMTGEDWRQVLDAAAEMGVEAVQFIGGEPTLHPDFASLVEHALKVGMHVEVFTNLVRVNQSWWSLFQHPDVSVATSYYTDDFAAHDAFTGRAGSHAQTRANIAEAVRLGVRLRAIVVDFAGVAHTARADLMSLGVSDIRISHVREIGRGSQTRPPSTADLCGRCGQGQAAIDSRGDVSPCVLARWIRIGNVRQDPVREILAGPRMAAISTDLSVRVNDSDDCSPVQNGPGCGSA